MAEDEDLFSGDAFSGDAVTGGGNNDDTMFSGDAFSGDALQHGSGQQDYGEAGGFSALGAMAHQAIVHAPEMAAGGLGGILAGGAVGTAIGGIPGTVAGIATGLGAGIGGSYLAAGAKDWLLDQLGLREGTGFWSRAQEEAAQAEHPYASFAGDMLDTLITGAPQKGAGMAARALGAAIMGGAEAGQEYYNEGKVDPLKTVGAAAVGAALPGQQQWVTNVGERIAQAGSKLRGTGTGAIQNPVAEAGQPGRPDLVKEKAVQEQQADWEEAKKTGNFAAFNRKWGTQKTEAEPQPDTGDIEVDVTPEMTKSQVDQQNDKTLTSRGVSEEQPAPVQNDLTGNPVGAAMDGRVAQRPNEPGRNYGKDAQYPDQDIETTPSTSGVITGTDPTIAAALKATQGETNITVNGQRRPDLEARVLQAQQTARPEPQAPEPPPPVETGPRETWAVPPEPPPEPPAPRAETGLTFKGDALHAPAPAPEVTVREQPKPPPESAATKAARADLEAKIKENPDLQAVKDAIETLPPERQAEAYARYADVIKTMPKEEPKAEGAPEKKPVPKEAHRLSIWEGGPTARDKADLARKQKTMRAVTDTHSENSTTAPTDPKELAKWAKGVFEAAKKANDGADPLVRPSYVPTEKGPHTDAYQWLRAVKKLSKAATPANIKAFQALALEEKPVPTAEKKPTMGQLDEETKQIEDNIKRRPTLNEAGAEAELSKQAQGVEQAREVIPEFKGEGESKVYERQQKELRDWLNGLDDVDYRLVTNENPNLKAHIDGTQDPAAMHLALQEELAEAKARMPGDKITTAEADLPPKPIRNKADLDRFEPTKPGEAASKGKSLKGTPEFEKLKAQYANAKPREIPEDRLTQEEKILKGDQDSFVKHVKDFIGDEEGGVKLPDWITGDRKSLTSPDKDAATKDYGEQLTDQFHGYTNRITNAQAHLRAAIRTAPTLSKADQAKIMEAEQNKTIRSLPAKLREYYAEVVAPLKGRYNDIMNELKVLDETHNLRLDIPELHGGIETAFVPRIRKDPTGQAYDLADRANIDPVTGQTMSNWSPALQSREFLKLVPVDAAGKPTTGDRLVFIPGDGQITVKRNGAPQIISKNIPAEWKGNVGDTLNLKVKGKPGTYVVDHASINEVRQANGKDSSGKWRVDYHENSPFAWAHRVNQLEQTLERERLLVKIKNDPLFLENTTTDPKVADERGYSRKQTTLPQFAERNGKKLYMKDSLRWALDDFNQRGIGGSSEVMRQFNNAANGLIKTMYFFGPLVHAFNEADKWAIGRGFNWITPGGWRSLATNGAKAIQSVTKQDEIQRMIRDFGGNPMLAHTLTRDVGKQFAKRLGVELTTNASKWDPVAKLWGVSTRELANRMYDMSSKPMWWASDVLLTQRVLENIDLHKMSPKDAVAEAHNWVDAYRMPTTVALGKNEYGRAVSKILQTPALSLFGPYHYGIWHSYANLTKNLVSGAGPGGRSRAAGQLMMAGAMAYMVYPWLAEQAKKLTGNENTEFDPRGMSAISHRAMEVAEQKKGLESMVPALFTPSIPLNMGIQLAHGMQDWKGNPIVERGSSPGRKGVELLDWAARQAIPPYGQVSGFAQDKEANLDTMAGKFAQGVIGMRTPSEAAARYQDQIEKINAQKEKQRVRKPQGLLESLYDRLTE